MNRTLSRRLSPLLCHPKRPPLSFQTYAFSSTSNTKSTKNTTISFDDSELAYGSKSAISLIRAYSVFRLCTVGPIVRNAEKLYKISGKIIGEPLTNAIVKKTFFAHFCGGEDTEGLRPTINNLNENGINGILDYAAENAPDEVPGADDKNVATSSSTAKGGSQSQPARVYDYAGEKACDHHVDIFKQCIISVKDVTPNGFAALKLTALGNPKLLERMSTAIIESTRLFNQFDSNNDGIVTVAEFREGYTRAFTNAETEVPRLTKILDPNNTGHIDYIEWSKLLAPEDLPKIVANCRDTNGPLSRATPSAEELQLMIRAKERLWEIAQCAFDNDVRLLVDAEQTYYQPAIDNFVISLMKEFNNKDKSKAPIIFNTYQAYLKDTYSRVQIDVDRAQRNNYHFAAKVVRGAYMYAERQRAQDMGYPSPVQDSIEDSHKGYNNIIEFLLKDRMKRDTKAEVMLGTHNRESIEMVIKLLQDNGKKNNDLGVHFAQLLGMRDDLTFTLGRAKYNAYKYVPYGKVGEVMPYLIRRAQENSDITKGMGQELKLLEMEFARRIKLMFGFGK